MSPDPVDIAELIPHRPPMVMIDRLVRCDATSAEGIKTFHAGDYGISGGSISESLLVECLAQTVAAMQGYLLKQQGRKASQGLLVGIDNFIVYSPVRVGSPLMMTITVANCVGPFRIVSGSVSQDGSLLAEGQMKVFLQEDAHEVSTMPVA